MIKLWIWTTKLSLLQPIDAQSWKDFFCWVISCMTLLVYQFRNKLFLLVHYLQIGEEMSSHSMEVCCKPEISRFFRCLTVHCKSNSLFFTLKVNSTPVWIYEFSKPALVQLKIH